MNFWLLSLIGFMILSCFAIVFVKRNHRLERQISKIFLTNMDLVIILLKADGTVVRCNQSVETTLGWAVKDLIGKKYTVIDDPTGLAFLRQMLSSMQDPAAERDGRPTNESFYYSPDLTRPVRFQRQIIRNHRGTPQFLLLIGTRETGNEARLSETKPPDSGTNFELYRRVANESNELETKIARYLNQALDNGELYLLYQPQFSVKSGKIASFEALLRWKNPVLGAVAPNSFIQVAEATALIIPIGEWVLKSACQFLSRMHQQGFTECKIAVNVSIVQLGQVDFVERVLGILKEVGIPPRCLELELTESYLMESLDVHHSKLEKLKAAGIQIALDDFGTGYSSLSYLKQLKVNSLKIDKTFIDDIIQCKESAALTRNIIMIGHELGLSVIAEGVENQYQVDFLVDCGCDLIQGYYFGKPVLEKEAVAMLHKMNSAQAAPWVQANPLVVNLGKS